MGCSLDGNTNGQSMSEDLWDYLATDWLYGLEVDILAKDAEAVFRRLRQMSDELIPVVYK
jgi:hypothetical protein